MFFSSVPSFFFLTHIARDRNTFKDRSNRRLHVGVLLQPMVLAFNGVRTLNSNNVTLKHMALFLICFGAHSTICSLASLLVG